jgi:catechol 2,3-dioxygenase-like lactoylglutathione lyase family enzyme
MRPLYSHVDLRVRDREKAVAFYDPLLKAFGFELGERKPDDEWPTWRRPGGGRNEEFFGFEVDPNHVPNETRIAFLCETREEVERIAEIVKKNGARDVDGPPGYDDKYYACFFDDPEGNKLEVCVLS